MTRAATLLIAVLLLVRSPLAAQSETSWKAEALASIMAYRMSVLGDTATKFDGCSVARVLEVAPEHVVADFPEAVRALIAPCPSVAERSTRKVVLVDSLTREQDATVKGYLTIVRGEWVHREDYFFVLGPRVAVREVRVWGAVQSYPRRPPRD
ncbi:hypothetical protein [Longimicrobium sp.]|uniref:hypothetical protein n=1 Tax=Longimicrobium sp. TaxID=2029185 RepID=UPI003B3B062E